jgi:hypothetical protein
MIWVVSDSPVQSVLCSSCKGMVDLVHYYQTQEKGSAGKHVIHMLYQGWENW